MRLMALPAPVGVQKTVVTFEATGHKVVLGTAGSGKTTMAILRAAFLSNPTLANGGRTLLVTFNTALAGYLRHMLPDDLPGDVTVEHYHKFARGYLNRCGLLGGWGSIVRDSGVREGLIRDARDLALAKNPENPMRDFTVNRIAEEISWLCRQGFPDRETFVAHGNDTVHQSDLTAAERAGLYDVYEDYLHVRAQTNPPHRFDWEDIATAVRIAFESDTSDRHYKHVVIDEGQDFSPEMIRSLVAAVPADGSVTLFGDAAQQIYGRRISWRDAGLNVHEPIMFKKNYRNTRQIAELGLAIAAMPYYQGQPDMVAPDEYRAEGPPVGLLRFPSFDAERAFIKEQATEAIRSGQSVGILTRRRDDANWFARQIPRVQLLSNASGDWNPGAVISAGTLHAGKGLEFDMVFLPHVSSDWLPDPALVRALGMEEAEAQDGRALYVGVTRARQRLILTTCRELTSLLPTTPGLWEELTP